MDGTNEIQFFDYSNYMHGGSWGLYVESGNSLDFVGDFGINLEARWGDTYMSGDWVYVTANSGPLVIQADGDVGIETPSPQFTLHVNGSAGKPGGGSWSAPSDARLKKHIEALSGIEALEMLGRLRGVSYEWRSPEAHREGIEVGVLAQEVQQVFPGWVDEIRVGDTERHLIPEGDRALAVSFPHSYNAYVIEAIKELHHMLLEQDKELERLRALLCHDNPALVLCRPRLRDGLTGYSPSR
jgi:hypothetical protein